MSSMIEAINIRNYLLGENVLTSLLIPEIGCPAALNGLMFITQQFNACNYFILNGRKRCHKKIHPTAQYMLSHPTANKTINLVLKWKNFLPNCDIFKPPFANELPHTHTLS